VNLLPYHNIAMEKYRRMRKTYKLQAVEQPTEYYIKEIAELYIKQGVKVLIGG
jgi:pyruvate-formate lyase-activating enzyme